MTEATVGFASLDEIRLLFGIQDRYLRQLRAATGVNVTVRDTDVILHGTAEQVEGGVQIIERLQEFIHKQGSISEADVRSVLDPDSLMLKPRERGDDKHRGDDRPQGDENRNGSKIPSATASNANANIDLLEKARSVAPRTPGQREYAQAMAHNDLVFCIGPAGSGKTYLAVAMAVNALRREMVKKIVLVRPAVEAGEKLGFLPGDMLAKVNPFLRPLLDALNEMVDYEQVKRYMERDVIEVIPLAFMRGRTLNHTFIILDEGQNTTITQMKMFLTRLGNGSRIVVTGDTTQTDLPAHVPSGLIDAIERLTMIDGIASVQLTGRDIVRHRLVKEIVRAYDDERVLARPRHKG